MCHFYKFLLLGAALAFTGAFYSSCTNSSTPTVSSSIPTSGSTISSNSPSSNSQFNNCSENGEAIRANLIQSSDQDDLFSVSIVEAIEKAKMVYQNPQCVNQRPYFAEVLKAAMQRRVFDSYSRARQIAQSTTLLCMTNPNRDPNHSPSCQEEAQESSQRLESDYRTELRDIDDFFQNRV